MNRKPWLGFSLGLNLILAATLAIFYLRRSESARPTTGVQKESPGKRADKQDSNSKNSKLNEAAGNKPEYSDWRAWIDHLRAAGVPNQVIARVVQSDFEDRWQKQQEEYQRQFDRGDLDLDAFTALSRERDVDEEKELKAALGEEGFKKLDQENTLQNLNLAKLKLNSSEADSVYEWQKDLQNKIRALEQSKEKGEIDEADFNEQQDKLRAAFDQQLKSLLGDDRYAAMQGKYDPTGDLRRSLKSLNPSDSQFEDLLQAQRQWTERRADLDRQLQQSKSQGITYEEQIQSIDLARDQEYERVLGTNGFDAYQRAQDSRYNTMKRYADVWGMDDSSIDYTYRTIRYYEKTVDDYERQARALEQQGKAVDWDQMRKNLQQFSQQTERSLQSYLGDDRFSKMKRNQIFPFNQGE